MPIDRYRLWKRNHSDIGCVFARYMAQKPMEFGQRATLVPGDDPTALAREIADQIAAFVASPEVVAAAVVLPDILDLETLVHLAFTLGTQDHWHVTRTVLSGTPGGDVVAFNVVRDLPAGNSHSASEALVLGPFEEFPRTRRSPVTALEVFVGEPPSSRSKVHLANVPIEVPAQSVFTKMWEGSVRARLASLGGINDPRAKAKVTFAVPMDIAVVLGCVP